MPRFIKLEGDPLVVRDTKDGTNYHLESSLEALSISELLNQYEEALALAKVQIDNLKQEVLDLENTIQEIR